MTVFDWSAGRATERQVISTLGAGYTGHNTTAEIAAAPSGRHLYVSNRGEDSIVQFDITAGSGLLSYVASFPTGGRRPRFFTLGPGAIRLYAANQDSDDITMFAVDQSTGALVPSSERISVGSPSAISFVIHS